MVNEQFQWQRHPQAEALLQSELQRCCADHCFLGNLSRQLEQKTSTRLFDWIDHIALPDAAAFEALGYRTCCEEGGERLLHHPGAQLPMLLEGKKRGVALSVDSIEAFAMVHGCDASIEGVPYSGYRRCCVSEEKGVSLWVVERRGEQVIMPIDDEEGSITDYLRARQLWQCRQRRSVEEAHARADALITLVGQRLAAWIVLECEREYWQARNSAAQLQKSRQDRLGMGWANHDHHTFRSSRQTFRHLVQLFEKLGFKCRERFYAGEEAGWGAQVMEHASCRLVLFLDVDLDPHELDIDFSHQDLEKRDTLGTIGLWCALHGDSIGRAGMHHLEAQFAFNQLTADLAERGVAMMEPFSNFSYLKQAFTAGEVWEVATENIEKLLVSDTITQQEAERFRQHGAIGSHLENLERHEGYKGFNQKNVSFIIKKTDPRN